MALLTKINLQTLDIAFEGEPFAYVTGKALTTDNLDIAFEGEPFVVTATEAAAGVVKEFEAVFASTFVETVAISSTRGADLEAFSNASLTATAQVNKNTSATLGSQFTLSTVTTKQLFAQASLESLSELVADNNKLSSTDSTMSSIVTLSANADKILNSTATLNSISSITAMVSHLYGVDISAFSNASVTTDAVVIRSADATITSTATIDQCIGTLTAARASSISSEFAQTVSADRTRDTSATLASEFTFLGLIDIITPTGELKEFAASFSVEFAQSTIALATKEFEISLVSTAVMDPDGVQRTRGFDSTQTTTFAQTTSAGRIQQGACDFTSLFTPSASIDGVINTFAVLDSTSALVIGANANRSADIALSSIINLGLQGDKITDYAANLSCQSSLSINYVNTVPAVLDASATFTQAVTASATKPSTALLASSSTLTAQVEPSTKQATAELSGLFAELTVGDKVASRQFFVSALDTSYYSTDPYTGAYQWSMQGAHDTTTDAVGNVYSIGLEHTSNSTATYYYNNILIVKQSPRGDVLWQKKMDLQLLTTYNASCRIVEDGNKLYFGASGVTSAGAATCQLYSLDLTGSLTTAAKLDLDASFIDDMKVYNGNLYVLTHSIASNSTRALVVTKYTNNVRQWSVGKDTTTTYFADREVLRSKFDVNSTGVYVALQREGTVNDELGAYAKFDLNGNLVSFKEIAFRPFGMVLDSDNNIYVSGYQRIYINSTTVIYDFTIKKYDSSYNMLWSKYIERVTQTTGDLSKSDRNIIMAVSSTDDLIVVYNDDFPFVGTQSRIMKISSAGVITANATLRFENSSGVEISQSTLYTTSINIDNGWVQLGTRWVRTLAGSYPASNQVEYLVYQFPEDIVSKPSFKTSVYSTYRDSTNYNLVWNSASASTSLTNNDTKTLTNVTPGTSTSAGSTSTGSVTLTDIAYTVIPLFIAKDGLGILSAEFTTTALNNKITTSTAQLSSELTSTASAIKTASAQGTLIVEANVIPNGGYIRGITDTLSAHATLTGLALRTKQLAAEVSVNAEIFVEAQRIRGGDAVSLNTEVHATITGATTKQATGEFSAFVSDLTAINKIGVGLIGLDVTATQATTAVKTTTTDAVLHSELTQVTESVKTVRTSLDIEARATTYCFPDKIKSPDATLTVTVTQTTNTDASKISGIALELAATTELLTLSGIARYAQAQLDVIASLTPEATATKPFEVDLVGTSEQVTGAIKTVRPTLTFDSIASELVIGTKISFDPYYTYRVAPETRTFLVPEEETLYRVYQETRVNTIQG